MGFVHITCHFVAGVFFSIRRAVSAILLHDNLILILIEYEFLKSYHGPFNKTLAKLMPTLDRKKNVKKNDQEDKEKEFFFMPVPVFLPMLIFMPI